LGGIVLDQGDLNYKLKKCFIKHKPIRSCAKDFIKILNEENVNVNLGRI